MKRSLIAVVLIVIFAVACATTPVASTPQLRGVVSERQDNVLTVTATEGGATSTVNMSRSTRVYWQNGEEAGRSVLMKGHPVQVWLTSGTQDASKIIIAP